MSKVKRSKFVKGVVLTLVLCMGGVTCPKVGQCMPMKGAGTFDARIDEVINRTMSITSDKKNNVLNWDSFDVYAGETVKFDNGTVGAGANNYLNLINDIKPSAINGTIKGGNNVYLINPNGVIFGQNSVVNVGNLYASTQSIDRGDSFDAYVRSDGSLIASSPCSDIVNLSSSIVAEKVCFDGKEVHLMNNDTIDHVKVIDPIDHEVHRKDIEIDDHKVYLKDIDTKPALITQAGSAIHVLEDPLRGATSKKIKTCPRCGAALQDASGRCKKCGSAIKATGKETSSTVPPQKP